MTDYRIFEKTNTSNLQDAFDLKDTLTVEKNKVVLGNKDTATWQKLTKRSNFDNSPNDTINTLRKMPDYVSELGINPYTNSRAVHEQYLPYLKSLFIRTSEPLLNRVKSKQFTPLLESISYRLYYGHYKSCLIDMIGRATSGVAQLTDVDKFNRLLTSIEKNMNSNASNKNTDPRNSLGELYVLCIDYLAYVMVGLLKYQLGVITNHQQMIAYIQRYYKMFTGSTNDIEIKTVGFNLFNQRVDVIWDQLHLLHNIMDPNVQAIYNAVLNPIDFNSKEHIDTLVSLLNETVASPLNHGFDLAYTYGISSMIRASINKTSNDKVTFTYGTGLPRSIHNLIAQPILDQEVTVESISLPFVALLSVDGSEKAIVEKLNHNLGVHKEFNTPIKTFDWVTHNHQSELVGGSARASASDIIDKQELSEILDQHYPQQYHKFILECLKKRTKFSRKLVVIQSYINKDSHDVLGIQYDIAADNVDIYNLLDTTDKQMQALYQYGHDKVVEILLGKSDALALQQKRFFSVDPQSSSVTIQPLVSEYLANSETRSDDSNLHKLEIKLTAAIIYFVGLKDNMSLFPNTKAYELLQVIIAICLQIHEVIATLSEDNFEIILDSNVTTIMTTLKSSISEATILLSLISALKQLVDLLSSLIERIPMIIRPYPYTEKTLKTRSLPRLVLQHEGQMELVELLLNPQYKYNEPSQIIDIKSNLYPSILRQLVDRSHKIDILTLAEAVQLAAILNHESYTITTAQVQQVYTNDHVDNAKTAGKEHELEFDSDRSDRSARSARSDDINDPDGDDEDSSDQDDVRLFDATAAHSDTAHPATAAVHISPGNPLAESSVHARTEHGARVSSSGKKATKTRYPILKRPKQRSSLRQTAKVSEFIRMAKPVEGKLKDKTISEIGTDVSVVALLYDIRDWLNAQSVEWLDREWLTLLQHFPYILRVLLIDPFSPNIELIFDRFNSWLGKQDTTSELYQGLYTTNDFNTASSVIGIVLKDSEDHSKGFVLNKTKLEKQDIAANKYLRGGGEVETYFNKWISNNSGPNVVMCANFLFNADVRGYTDSDNVFVFKPFSEWIEAIGKDYGSGFRMITNFYYNFVSNNVKIYKNGKAYSKLIGNVWSSIAHVPTRQQVIGSANVVGMPTQLNILAPPIYDLFRSTLPLMAIVSERLTANGKTITKKSKNRDYNKALHTPAVLTGGGNNNYKTIVTSLLGEEFGQYANMTGGGYGVIIEADKFDGNYIVDKLEKEYELRVNQLKFKGIDVDSTDHQSMLSRFTELRQTVNEIKHLLLALQNAVVNKTEDNVNGPINLQELTQEYLDKAEDLKNSYTNTQQAILLVTP